MNEHAAPQDWLTSDFDYTLPESLIAQYPLPNRRDSRLLVVDVPQGTVSHKAFPDLIHYLQPHDLMVLNNTKVLPARLYGKRETGGKVEVMLERLLDETRMLAHVRSSKRCQPGALIMLEDGSALRYEGQQSGFHALRCERGGPLMALFERLGHMPLPPYMQRPDETTDATRYQSVFASQPGAVAAPTASLHFDEAMLADCASKGVARAEVTLHVGAGTYTPVRVARVADHAMHTEWLRVDERVVQAVQACRAQQGRVVAVGTTAVRSLETAAQSGVLKPYEGETQLFLKPGDAFHCVDVMLTNFHLPASTLLMLVCAFGGNDLVMQAYQEAIDQAYRFYSYGDAMLLIR